MNERRLYRKIAIFFFVHHIFNNKKISTLDIKTNLFAMKERERRKREEITECGVYSPRTTSSKCHPILARPE